MKNTFLLLLIIFTFYKTSFAQTSNEKIMIVVDSIPVIDDPEEGNELLQTDLSDITVVKNKDSLKLLGYGQFDGVTYLFTKEYRNRPENIKQIPSSKQMVKKDGTFYFRDKIYNGPFIDYYYSGKKQGEGFFLNGKINGNRKRYYQNGNLFDNKDYTNGIANGLNNEYYENGKLKQTGNFVYGKEEGIWESYYPNGQVKLRSKYKTGEVYDTAVKYYSTGKIKELVLIKNGKVIADPNLIKIRQLMANSNESNKAGNTKAAIKYLSKIIAIDSGYAEAYFSKGTIELNEFQFDDAIADLNKALQFEPFMEFALANRAFARIRKYQFGSSRTLLKNSEVTVLAGKDKVPIPDNEKNKICDDLHKAIFLGNKSEMIKEALADYCSK